MNYIPYDQVDDLVTMSQDAALSRWPRAVVTDHAGRLCLRAEGPHAERYIVSFYENETGGYWANMSQ